MSSQALRDDDVVKTVKCLLFAIFLVDDPCLCKCFDQGACQHLYIGFLQSVQQEGPDEAMHGGRRQVVSPLVSRERIDQAGNPDALV